MNLEFINKLVNNVKESDLVQNFINELVNFIESNKNQSTKYNKYWEYQNFMEYNVAATIGISRWSADNKYHDELSEAIDNSLLELSEKEGTLYRKKSTANGPIDNPTYSIDKFENGKIEHLILPSDKVPKGFDNEDIIFQYRNDGTTKVREDLKEEAVKLASKNSEDLKVKENEKTTDYKREGHIYQAFENDGYIFLKDLTEKRDYLIEDIEFVVDCYQGEGRYQVIDGEYRKIND